MAHNTWWHLIGDIVFMLVLASVTVTDGALRDQNVYIQRMSVGQRLYVVPLPATLSNFTTCLWLNLDLSTKNCYPVDIVTANDSKAHRWGWKDLDTNSSRVFFENSYDNDSYPLSEELKASLFSGWHKHCVVNEPNVLKWYMDVNEPGVMVEMFSTHLGASEIPMDSYLSVMQNQNSYGSGFSTDRLCVGKLAMFNVWDIHVPLDSLRCDWNGNFVDLDNLTFEGTDRKLHFTKMKFPCPGVLGEPLQRDDNVMMFCKIPNKSITGAVLEQRSATTLTECAQLCVANKSCRSANFVLLTSTCELNGISQADSPLSLVAAPGTVHLSSEACTSTD